MRQLFSPKQGIAPDFDQAVAPDTFWSDAWNVRFDEYRVTPIGGYRYFDGPPITGRNSLVYHLRSLTEKQGNTGTVEITFTSEKITSDAQYGSDGPFVPATYNGFNVFRVRWNDDDEGFEPFIDLYLDPQDIPQANVTAANLNGIPLPAVTQYQADTGDKTRWRLQGSVDIDFVQGVSMTLTLGESTDGSYWLCMGRDNVWIRDRTAQVWYEISGGNWNMTPANPTKQGSISSCELNGVPVFVSADQAQGEPWFWGLDPNVDMQPLTGWPENYTIRGSIIAAKYHLFAVNIDINDTNYPNRVMWSSAAEPGTIPDSWDATAANDAGFVDLGDTEGGFITGLQIGDFVWLAKHQALYTAQYIGGQSIWNFRLRHSDIGVLGRHCLIDVNGRPFIITENDIGFIEGESFRSVAENRVRRTIFNNLRRDVADNSYMVHYPFRNEIWCYFPLTTNIPNRAYIYNYQDDTWTSAWNQPALCSAQGELEDRPNQPIVMLSTQDELNDSDPEGRLGELWQIDDTDTTDNWPMFETIASDQYVVSRYKLPVDVNDPQQEALITDAWVQAYEIDELTGPNNPQFYFKATMRRNDPNNVIGGDSFDPSSPNPVPIMPGEGRYLSFRVTMQSSDSAIEPGRMRIDSVQFEGYPGGTF